MLAKLAPKFVISRVIQNSYLAENQTIQLLKTTFEYRAEQFSRVNSMNYETCRFYGYISTLQKPVGFANKYEEQAYEQACQRFKTFNQVLDVYNHIEDFYHEVRMLYSYVERNNSSSNFFTQRIQTDKQFESDVIASIEKYQKFENDLAAFPEWQEKVKDQIGGIYHVIFNNLAESEAKRKVFDKLNHQEFFL